MAKKQYVLEEEIGNSYLSLEELVQDAVLDEEFEVYEIVSLGFYKVTNKLEKITKPKKKNNV